MRAHMHLDEKLQYFEYSRITFTRKFQTTIKLRVEQVVFEVSGKFLGGEIEIRVSRVRL